jgi:hypothetical protein
VICVIFVGFQFLLSKQSRRTLHNLNTEVIV